MLTPPESDQYWLGLVSAAATLPRSKVAPSGEPGSGAISSSGVDDLLQTWSGVVNTPDRHTNGGEVIEFSLAAIQALTAADVLVVPAGTLNVTVQELGGPIGAPVGVWGFGIILSPSAGAVPSGSMANELAVTGGAGWVITSGARRAAGPVGVPAGPVGLGAAGEGGGSAGGGRGGG